MPTDLYYSDLDRSWDENDNNIFGEVPEDKIDMYADVFVGRAPVNTIEETENIVNKDIQYETNPPLDDYPLKMLFMAFDINYDRRSEFGK